MLTSQPLDTAPTGHCLRLLRFPEFLDGFFGKIIKLKQRLDSTLGSIRNVFSRSGTAEVIDTATVKLGEYRGSMKMLRELILDGDRTQFVCVTIPTGLAMAGASQTESLPHHRLPPSHSFRSDGALTNSPILTLLSHAPALQSRSVS